LEKCGQHKEDNKFFCLDCKIFLCSICAIDDHPQHKTMSIFKYGEILKSELNSSMLSFQELIDHLNHVESKYRVEMIEKQNQRDQLMKELKEIEKELKNIEIKAEEIVQETKKVEVSYMDLKNSIEEMKIIDLLDQDFRQNMQEKIKTVFNEFSPIKQKFKPLRNFAIARWHQRHNFPGWIPVSLLQARQNWPEIKECFQGFTLLGPSKTLLANNALHSATGAYYSQQKTYFLACSFKNDKILVSWMKYAGLLAVLDANAPPDEEKEPGRCADNFVVLMMTE